MRNPQRCRHGNSSRNTFFRFLRVPDLWPVSIFLRKLISARDHSREGSLGIALQHATEIDVFNALDVNALESRRFG
jgi:hypothetical protein